MSRDERVRVLSIAAGGAGVARARDGRVLFVQRTAPGDDALVRIAPSKKRWSHAQLVELFEGGPERRVPPCPHYVHCGGCTIEHLQYDAQLRTKSEIVREAMRRIGGFEIETPEVVASPYEFRYRNRVSFTLRRQAGKQVVAGFHELGRADRVVDITETCMLPEPSLGAVWGAIRKAWGADAARLPSGTELRLTLRVTRGGDASLLIEGGYGGGQPDVLLQLVPQLLSIWHRPRLDEPAVLIGGDAYLVEQWGDAQLRVGGALFLQVNRGAAQLLDEHVLQVSAAVPGLSVVDAYCGTGLHARRLAEQGATVTGIELDPHAVAEAQRAGVMVIEGTVESALPSVLPTDLLIMNPPRSGVDQQVIHAILQAPPRRMIYISCDPATLARDLARLRDAYHIASVRCFDLFPQATHVETVVELVCSIT
ncbi:MAG: methyltransferase domain-containing protein [Longimicrobiales bacterium]